ncbi:unnamed protein product [Arabis nemorensis]|uniref:Uncharacterized protein n=1 Tax=Arabis nemorensis TaxID=586526 RepID=A0A565ASK1_9BRAS|nr:unnamed protein product [Arabis nemorensis]
MAGHVKSRVVTPTKEDMPSRLSSVTPSKDWSYPYYRVVKENRHVSGSFSHVWSHAATRSTSQPLRESDGAIQQRNAAEAASSSSDHGGFDLLRRFVPLRSHASHSQDPSGVYSNTEFPVLLPSSADWNLTAGEISLFKDIATVHNVMMKSPTSTSHRPEPPALFPLGPREPLPPPEPPDLTLAQTSSKARPTPSPRSFVTFPVVIDFPSTGQILCYGMGLNTFSQPLISLSASPTEKSSPSSSLAISTSVEISSIGDGLIFST